MADKKIIQPAVQLDVFAAAEQASKGLEWAEIGADARVPGWAEKAYSFFVEWLFRQPNGREFFVEDFRDSLKGKLELPPSNRAFGGLPRRAVGDGLIEWVRMGKTRSKSAHRANASVWRKL